MKDLKHRAIRGGIAKIGSQIANLLIRTGSLMVLARLLSPKDFGLVGMVTAITGIFGVFRDFGLSAAAVQRAEITQQQSSTLFWINLFVGILLGLLALSLAPFIVALYHEPRLFGIAAVLASAFVFNAAGVQHLALLERQMRFTTLAVIDVFALTLSAAIAMVMAIRGFGYWALVTNATVVPLLSTLSVWLCVRWIPARPRARVGIRSLMSFGGTITLNGLIMYLASNVDKILVGRYWGVYAIGIYGRSYQLVNIPIENLNSSAGSVAFAGLSRLQNEPKRLRSYFLKGYSLVMSATIPIACGCMLFANDIIGVCLGPKWKDAAAIFRIMAPAIVAFAAISPLGWLLNSMGLVKRGLHIAIVLGPAMVTSYLIGIAFGPVAVAVAYTCVVLTSIIPVAIWATRGTPVSVRDIVQTISRPLISAVVSPRLYSDCSFFMGLSFLHCPGSC